MCDCVCVGGVTVCLQLCVSKKNKILKFTDSKKSNNKKQNTPDRQKQNRKKKSSTGVSKNKNPLQVFPNYFISIYLFIFTFKLFLILFPKQI